MGQLFSNLWNWICPTVKNETPRHDHQVNYQTFRYNDIEVKQLDEEHFINVSDHPRPPISDSSTRIFGVHDTNNNLGTSTNLHIVVDLISGNEDYKEQVLEKDVTTSVDYVVPRSTCSATTEVVRALGPYTSAQTILLVGEGDFSFSASLAVAFGSCGLRIVATSLNSEDFLIKNYRKFRTNKKKLETRGCLVLHGVDATKMAIHPILGSMVFDRIIYNFPHAGKFGKGDSELRMHQKLVSGFLRNAKKMIKEDGEIHVTSKSSRFFREWNIPTLGRDQGLRLIQEVKFRRNQYPGYHTMFGFGGDRYFHCNPSKTYKFGVCSG